jgi:DNA-binding beta-propeller fold protein YncE
VARRLVQIPGVGVITATALIGAVGHIHAFRRGRHFASWLGLTPRESSSGGRRRLGGISKRGDVYLRCLLDTRRVLRLAEGATHGPNGAESGDALSAVVLGDILNTPGVHGAALATKAGHGFTTNGGDETVTMFDLKTLAVLKQIKVGPGLDGIMYDEPDNKIILTNHSRPIGPSRRSIPRPVTS